MKQPALVPTFIALVVAMSGSMALAPGCGGETTKDPTGGSGGTGGSTTSTGGAGGTTTTTTMVSMQCSTLCDHLASIECNVLQNCATDCDNHLNAPEACQAEADALIACWVEHLQEFMCTMQQVLPPQSCNEEETVFNTCVNGGGAPDASCICSAGVGVGDKETNCSRKTTCGPIEYTQVCQKLQEGQPWTCSCFQNGGLLGTCSEIAEIDHCSNEYGCCVPLFCASSQE
jgi:hypothetical protein